ncbi:MAG: helix-turn-helix domain-containing protein [Gemmatimonadota bacterium]
MIRERREALGLSLRQLAKTIGKSPSFVLSLERESSPPSASEETLRILAGVLDVDADAVITLAGKTPQDVTPESALEVSLYRRVKEMSIEEQQRLLRRLDKRDK